MNRWEETATNQESISQSVGRTVQEEMRVNNLLEIPTNSFTLVLVLFTECPPAVDGMERFACPSPDRQGRYRCIDDHVLCDGFVDCPLGEDEDRKSCMFYKTVSSPLQYNNYWGCWKGCGGGAVFLRVVFG